MNILLVDIDSKIPNLALMKLSAWHKSQGDQAGWNVPDPDRVYASVIFKKNIHKLDGLKVFYPDAKIIVGGSGVDLDGELPPEVERIRPDYSLYPNIDYSMGFTTRGCIRKCYFCVVPQKEGDFRKAQHPAEWMGDHKRVKLLDNNWTAGRDWFFETSQYFIDNQIAVDVTQGLDIRIITPEIATQLSRLKWWASIHFAYDQADPKLARAVQDGIAILNQNGIKVRSRVHFFVYCHGDDQYDSAVSRCRDLKKWGATPFVMFNLDAPRTARIKKLQHWANRPWLFWKTDIEGLK